MNVQGFGAGVGRVGPYYEQGNWYRGGAVQMLFITWLYGEQNQVRPMFPPNTPQRGSDRARRRLFDLAPQHAAGRLVARRCGTCRRRTSSRASTGPRGIFADAMPVATGGAMIQRAPNDPAWYKGGLWHDNMPLNVPGLWFMSWYDVSVGPNLAMYNHVRKTAKPRGRRPAVGHHRAGRALRLHARHRGHRRRRAQHGRRAARLQRDHLRLLRPVPEGREATTRLDDACRRSPTSRWARNKWQTSDTWPPAGAQPMTFYPVERRQGEHAERRRRAGGRAAGHRHARRVHLRPDEPGAVVRRQRLLHRQRRPGRLLRPAQDGGAARHPRLHLASRSRKAPR